ncbi:MAG: ZIP family metal transporter [Solirubrobacteraceae bacterium]|nr:ZIP family metal transporter [Solirubrobacteraceae bacterium]
MPDLLALVLAATVTMVATGVGALPVIWLGDRAERLRGALWGVAAGTMAVASVTGLLLPAMDSGAPGAVTGGLVAGGVFVFAARVFVNVEERRRGAGASARDAVLVFAVLFVHSLPEGLAIGTAWASTTAGLSTFVVAAIAVQNVPEGTATAIPMRLAGAGPARLFWGATLTSLPQPVGAVVAYLAVEQVESLLPFSFAFAAGAMLVLVIIELIPKAWSEQPRWSGAAGAGAGAVAMLALGAVLGV